jgi:hypothetical protein
MPSSSSGTTYRQPLPRRDHPPPPFILRCRRVPHSILICLCFGRSDMDRGTYLPCTVPSVGLFYLPLTRKTKLILARRIPHRKHFSSAFFFWYVLLSVCFSLRYPILLCPRRCQPHPSRVSHGSSRSIILLTDPSLCSTTTSMIVVPWMGARCWPPSLSIPHMLVLVLVFAFFYFILIMIIDF